MSNNQYNYREKRGESNPNEIMNHTTLTDELMRDRKNNWSLYNRIANNGSTNQQNQNNMKNTTNGNDNQNQNNSRVPYDSNMNYYNRQQNREARDIPMVNQGNYNVNVNNSHPPPETIPPYSRMNGNNSNDLRNDTHPFKSISKSQPALINNDNNNKKEREAFYRNILKPFRSENDLFHSHYRNTSNMQHKSLDNIKQRNSTSPTKNRTRNTSERASEHRSSLPINNTVQQQQQQQQQQNRYNRPLEDNMNFASTSYAGNRQRHDMPNASNNDYINYNNNNSNTQYMNNDNNNNNDNIEVYNISFVSNNSPLKRQNQSYPNIPINHPMNFDNVGTKSNNKTSYQITIDVNNRNNNNNNDNDNINNTNNNNNNKSPTMSDMNDESSKYSFIDISYLKNDNKNTFPDYSSPIRYNRNEAQDFDKNNFIN